MPKRVMTLGDVTIKRRVYQTVTLSKKVLQCERPYVLFGKAVRSARLDLGLTQQALADLLGYARPTITNIEIGRQRVLLDDVFRFAKVLKLKPITLFNAVI
jgi:DNA-binding XRE family transcriptional regulator